MSRAALSSTAAFLFISGAVAYADVETAASASPVGPGAPEAWQPEDGDVIAFDVYRKGDKKFGTHTVKFDVDSPGNFTATSDVNLKAGLGPITVFKYKLNAAETWKNGTLVELDAETNDDGDDEQVSASVDGDKLTVNGTGYSGTAPLGIIPSSHWNIKQAFSSEILSTESGELLDTKVTKIGEETIQVDGQDVQATHYRLVSDITVDLWYDRQNRWVQLSFEARGQQIDYRLASLY